MSSVRTFLQHSLRWLVPLAPCALAVAACERPQYTYSDDVPVKGTGASSSFTGTPTAGKATSGGSSVTPDPCAFNRTVSGTPLLKGQVVTNQAAGRAEVYAELTDAEVIALKAGGSLLPVRPAQTFVVPPLTAALRDARDNDKDSVRRDLLRQLVDRFPVSRSTWPNPWALRLVDHPGSQHMNPVELVFKPDAWIVKLTDKIPTIVDVNNMPVDPEQVQKAPERIVGVFYMTGAFTPGSSPQCDTGRRELALTNEAMVESFSLGTQAILDHLNADIDDLNAFFQVARPCTSQNAAITRTFQSDTVCTGWLFPDTITEYHAYIWSLSTPVELYKPTPQNLASLISALEADRFEVKPFTGTPHPPVSVVGAGGAGGADAGGANAGGAGGADSGFPQGGI